MRKGGKGEGVGKGRRRKGSKGRRADGRKKERGGW